MLSQPISKSFDLGDGRIVTIETGKLARQADGAVTVRQGNCILLATVVANKEPREGQDFFPLSVDYQEKFASAGRIPGSFFKREARLNDYEILTSRLIDRALRPLFPEDYLCDVQVLISLVSSDAEVMPDALACLAASAALAVSDIPIKEIISEVRIATVDGEMVINPTRSQLARATSEFLIAATEKNLMMVEGEAKECSEEDLVKALEMAHDAIRLQIKAQAELRDLKAVTGKRDYRKPEANEEINQKVIAFAKDKVYAISKAGSAKNERSEAYSKLKEELIASLGEEATDADKKFAKKYYEDLKWEVVRNMILEDRVRLDGRKLDEVRPLAMEIEPLPTPHGSALFTRGETQSLTTVTLGTKLDELLVESAANSNYSKFFLHYNFPPFSTGEVKMMRGVGRREVGHGNLAQRSLKQMMPGSEYPYTVRVVSDILESNGSSSMATVCAGSLALMDAGVPVQKHVSGVAMGLISREDGKYAILTDILGDEDHLGDMDFKVTGTADGITACQMDIKIDGLRYDIMEQALDQAREGRLHILSKLTETIATPRPDVKKHAPKIIMRTIPGAFIGALIGPGGKVIQELQKATGTTIVINEVDEQGVVEILGTDPDGIAAVLAKIDSIIFKPEMGEAYEVKVIKMLDFGAVVEYTQAPGNEVLLHVSELAWERTENVSDVVKMGDVFQVKYLGIDPKTRKEKVSRKALLPRPPRSEENKITPKKD